MADVLLGVVYALIAATGWGSYLVPMRKLANPDPLRYVFFTSIGIITFALISSLALNYSISINPIGIATGIMWTIASITSMFAIKAMGLGKASATWMSISVLTSFIWGIVLVSEQLNLLLLGIVGIILIISGVACMSLTNEGGGRKMGLLLAIITGSIFGFHLVPMKMAGIPVSELLFPMSLGIFVGSSIAMAVRTTVKKHEPVVGVKSGFLSGIIWSVANLSSLMAIATVGLSVGFPLSQISILVATLWGLFYFKEAKNRNKKIMILVGAMLMLFGMFSLAFSK